LPRLILINRRALSPAHKRLPSLSIPRPLPTRHLPSVASCLLLINRRMLSPAHQRLPSPSIQRPLPTRHLPSVPWAGFTGVCRPQHNQHQKVDDSACCNKFKCNRKTIEADPFSLPKLFQFFFIAENRPNIVFW
jgi:hypothetical protein